MNVNVKLPFDKKFHKRRQDGGFSQLNKEVRIAKRLSELGVASRREAEEMIKNGKVKVNNFVVDVNCNVTYDDKIVVDGQEIANVYVKPRLFLMNKPADYITSTNDPKGRKTVFDLIPTKLGKLISVGRLDYNTEGLLLFTNNGELARYFELPANKIKRVYRVRVLGRLDLEKLKSLRDGVTIDGIQYGKVIVVPEKYGEMANSWLKVIVFEGKNLEIRRIMMHCGLKVVKLVRVQYGDYRLTDIPKGCILETRIIPKFHLSKERKEFTPREFVKKPDEKRFANPFKTSNNVDNKRQESIKMFLENKKTKSDTPVNKNSNTFKKRRYE